MPTPAPGVLHVTIGLPASGKSGWARAQVAACAPGAMVRINRDDLRYMGFGPTYGQPLHDAEELITLIQHGPIVELLRRGVDVIIDDTNLRSRALRTFLELGARAGAEVRFVDDFLDVDVDECVRRDQARKFPVGGDVIRGMHAKFLRGGRRPKIPTLDAPVTGVRYEPKPGSTVAVMVDIDGTVALHGDRNPHDTSRYHEDRPNETVVEIVQSEASAGQAIVFCSGRSEAFREVTEQWLAWHVLDPATTPWELHMRPDGDLRNDAIVKLELFDRHIRDRFNVRRVYDDRDRVVQAWRSIGLTVLQVAEGNF